MMITKLDSRDYAAAHVCARTLPSPVTARLQA